MSTERRGRSRTNRLIAVPPLRAKHASSVTRGRTRMRRATCRLYMSANAIQIPGNGYVIGGVEDAAFDKHTLAAAQIDSFLVESLEPWMLVPIGKIEEQTLDLDARAILQEFLQARRA